MKKLWIATVAGLGLMMSTPSMAAKVEQPAIQVLQSKKNVAQTVDDLRHAIEAKGMTIFAVIDHQAAAQKVGLTMQPATVIVYGTPQAGTPLMVKDPLFALSLPLKVLVSQLPDGKVIVAHQSTEKLIEGSQIQAADVQNSLAKAEVLIANIVAPQAK